MRRLRGTILPRLEIADSLVYALVSIVFLAAAVGMLVFTVVSFPRNLAADGFPIAIISTVNDLLLVMIIMEVLRTLLSYLDQKASSLQPFLFIAAISGTRRILAIGAQMSVAGDTITPERFQQAMVDLGVNAGAILAIALALFLLGRHAEIGPPAFPTDNHDSPPEPASVIREPVSASQSD